MLEGEPVSRWRVVTWHSGPKRRRLIGAGYYRELDDAAMVAHRHAVGNAGSNIIQTAGASINMSVEKAIFR